MAVTAQQPQAPPAGAPAGAPGAQGPGPGAAGAGRGGGGRGTAPLDYADNEGWVSLFDGQTLNGWDGDPRYWSVKDGAIAAEPSCEKPTGTIYLVWQGGEPADFMLKFESKGTGNVNGGMQYRSYLTADSSVALKYPGRGGGGTLGRAAGAGAGGAGRAGAAAPQTGAAGAPGANPQAAGARGGAAGPGGGAAGQPGAAVPGGRGGGRGPQCANPGTPPTTAERAKWDMAGPQLDFDAGNNFSGMYYEQAGRGIAATPGQIVLAEAGKRTLLATIADRATLDSWAKKEDFNQFLLIAKGHTITSYMNGHLISVFIDNDPTYFRANGKIGLEVESTGGYYTKNIWMKRLN
jgi:hypothetical protein